MLLNGFQCGGNPQQGRIPRDKLHTRGFVSVGSEWLLSMPRTRAVQKVVKGILFLLLEENLITIASCRCPISSAKEKLPGRGSLQDEQPHRALQGPAEGEHSSHGRCTRICMA